MQKTGRLEGVACEEVEVGPTGVEKAVCDFLSENGYVFDTDVRLPSCPVGIAVRDSKDATRYILGIECDGLGYAGQKSVHDRNVLHADILRGLGWKTCRAWSVDWMFDGKKALEELLELLKRNCRDAA